MDKKRLLELAGILNEAKTGINCSEGGLNVGVLVLSGEDDFDEDKEFGKVELSITKDSCRLTTPESYCKPADLAAKLRKMADWLDKNKDKPMTLDN
jgi:hypothetical protein